MTRIILNSLLSLLLLSAQLCAANSIRVEDTFAKKVDYLYQHLPEVQKLKTSKEAAYKQAIGQVLDEEVDVQRMSRGIMGSYFNQSSVTQRKAFYQKLRNDFIEYCAAGLSRINFKTFSKPSVIADNSKNAVKLEFQRHSGGRVPVLVSLTPTTATKKTQVVNVVVAGMNVGVMLQHQFSAAVFFAGGNIDDVIKNWRPITL